MAVSTNRRRLLDAYRFPFFRPLESIRGIFGDPKARVITLVRRSKKQLCGACGRVHWAGTTARLRRVRDLSCGDTRIYLEFEVRRVDCRSCGKVKRERLDFLADNPLYTKRFAYYVGRRCRICDDQGRCRGVASWTGTRSRTLDKQYMKAQLRRAGTPGPQAIGIDEISIRKGHTYRIVVSDLHARPADLVWRQGPLGGEHGAVL